LARLDELLLQLREPRARRRDRAVGVGDRRGVALRLRRDLAHALRVRRELAIVVGRAREQAALVALDRRLPTVPEALLVLAALVRRARQRLAGAVRVVARDAVVVLREFAAEPRHVGFDRRLDRTEAILDLIDVELLLL